MERLWGVIEKEKIKVKYIEMAHYPEKVNGLYLYDHEMGPVIFLGNHLSHNRRLHKCVLAEEIGHHYTSPRTNILATHTSSNLQIILNQDERKALQWASDFLMPDRELAKALERGYRSCYELAEYFDITEWMVYRKLGFLKMCFRRAGIKVRGRDIFDMTLDNCCVDLLSGAPSLFHSITEASS